jgi:hypothetical protein
VTLCVNLAPKRNRIDVVDESPLAGDLDDRQPLAITRFELRLARDVDFPEGDARIAEHRPRPLAQVTAFGVEEDDVDYG